MNQYKARTMDKNVKQSELKALHAKTKEELLVWANQFENDHHVFDVYGETVTVDLPRQTVEKVMDISLLLVDRVIDAKSDLHTVEYEELESKIREKYQDDEAWLLRLTMAAVGNDHLYGRYRDIPPMIGKLMPRGCHPGTASYLLTVLPELYKLIYAVIRHVDDAEENYRSLAYTFFVGTLTKGWGEGYGWSKTNEGSWVWKNVDIKDS